MARVGVETTVLTDPRYRILADELGVDVWSAIGRMVAVWHHCQETYSYVLSEAVVNFMFSDAPVMVKALLRSGLGKKHRHGIYISGTRGRIEWLEKKRRTAQANGRNGGRPAVTNDEPIKNPRRLRTETPPATATASVSKEDSKALFETPTAAAVASKKAPAVKKTKARLPEDWSPGADLLAAMKARYPSLNLAAEVERFRNHWIGHGTPMADWSATFRNWCLKAQEFASQRPLLKNASGSRQIAVARMQEE